MNSEVQPRRGLKSALETARVVFARVYRLHPSAHNFAPIERQRERKRGAKGLVAQQRDEQRRTKIARLSACVRLYERVDERVKDNNKRDEQRCGEKERENASARYPSIDAVHREEYSIRWPNIGKR